MSFEKYLRQKQIEKEATEAASKSVNEVIGKMMRSEFQDVFKDAYDHWIDDACSHRYNASKSLALQVWQHQQSKIDEMQKQRDSFIKAYEIEMDESYKLQKRLDAALEVVKQGIRKQGSNYYLEKVEELLEGGDY